MISTVKEYTRKYGYLAQEDIVISLNNCKQGYLYLIDSRNLSIGVFNGETGFIGIREKFGNRYLFTEYHWEQGAPYGTVNPLEEIEKCPLELSFKNHNIEVYYPPLFDYLEAKCKGMNITENPSRKCRYRI